MCSSFLFWIFYTNVFLLLSAMLRVNTSITMCVDSGMLGSAVIFIRIDNASMVSAKELCEIGTWKKWSESKPFAEIGHDLKNVFHMPQFRYGSTVCKCPISSQTIEYRYKFKSNQKTILPKMLAWTSQGMYQVWSL